MSPEHESAEPPPLGDDRYVEHWNGGEFSLTVDLGSDWGVWTARIVMIAFAGMVIREIHAAIEGSGGASWWMYLMLVLAVSGLSAALWRPARVRSRLVIGKQRTRVSYEPQRGGRPIDVPTQEVAMFVVKGVSGARGLYLRTSRTDVPITIGMSWTSKPLAARLNFALDQIRAAPGPDPEATDSIGESPMSDEARSEPPPLDSRRFHERWGNGTFELLADRQPWNMSAAIGTGGAFVVFVCLVCVAIAMWSSHPFMSLALVACLSACLVFWGSVVVMRFSRVSITLSRHEVRVAHGPARKGEKGLIIPRKLVTAFATRQVGDAGSGVVGQTTVERLVVRTRDGDREIGWKTFASESHLCKQLAARLNWALAQVDLRQGYRD
jgi:hypothetical protein